MIAVDTNILVYSQREDSVFHSKSKQLLTDLGGGGERWAIPWPCLHEFVAIVTNPKIYRPPTSLSKALLQVEAWLECPTLETIGESGDYWPIFRDLVSKGNLTGPKIHDARIAAICIQNGVKTFWSADRDFSQIKGLPIKNPLL